MNKKSDNAEQAEIYREEIFQAIVDTDFEYAPAKRKITSLLRKLKAIAKTPINDDSLFAQLGRNDDISARQNYFLAKIMCENGILPIRADKKCALEPSIYCALEDENLPLVQLLLKNGADPNEKVFIRESDNRLRDGWKSECTPLLFLALRHEKLDYAKVLVKYGANVNAVDAKKSSAIPYLLQEEFTGVGYSALKAKTKFLAQYGYRLPPAPSKSQTANNDLLCFLINEAGGTSPETRKACDKKLRDWENFLQELKSLKTKSPRSIKINPPKTRD